MNDFDIRNSGLIAEAKKLRDRFEFSKKITPDFYEPGMMEYLDKSYGEYDADNKTFLLRFEAKGTRYDGRTELAEKLCEGDDIYVLRDRENSYNPNNFTMINSKGKNIGHVPAQLCNAMAPLYENGELTFVNAKVSFVEPISKRSRYAKQAMIFVEVLVKLN